MVFGIYFICGNDLSKLLLLHISRLRELKLLGAAVAAARFVEPLVEALLVEAVRQAHRDGDVVERRTQGGAGEVFDRIVVFVAVFQDVRVAKVVAGTEV